ncbi:12-oxophytodienoate reductase 2 [Rhizoctonia solani]|uniref:12-oxophytodienoate reductase 2 n=1 Tax=Rhizoctonia solani TaxID=456999 RepID=A0A8H8P0V3_9AGAM|nr:12-oxophytodienoate reductase 2 [Rhizoctonia solani]QRW21921.1 12-oxophytodienoate reductase 2 [Rhizoctonia solani]
MQPQPIPMLDLFPPKPKDIDHDTELYHLELKTIPELNLTHIWEQVMQAHSPLNLGDQELCSKGSHSHSTHTSKMQLDLLELGGSDLDELADVDNMEYNPATYGLLPKLFIQEQLLVKVAKLGYLANLNNCPYCHSPCLDPSGRLYSIFQHIPLIPQLQALFWNQARFLKMLYWSEFQQSGTHVRDVFDAILYELLCTTRVVVDGVEQPYQHFEDF